MSGSAHDGVAAVKPGQTYVGKQGFTYVYHASYYAAFLIDPSGNRVEAVCHSKFG
jgi:hypothetical protein